MEQHTKKGFLKLPPSSPYHDLPIFVSLLSILGFLAIGLTFPIRDELFWFLFPKTTSSAAQTGMALKDNVVSIPLVIDSPRPFKSARFVVSATNGSIVGVTCGIGSYAGTENTATDCTVQDSQLSTTTGPKTVGYITVRGTGDLGSVLTVTGSNVQVRDLDNVLINGATLVESNYTISPALPQGQRAYFPIQFQSSVRVTAAEFSPVVGNTITSTGRALHCGGDRFSDSGASSSTRCIVFIPVTDEDRQNNTIGALSGIVGIVSFTPTSNGSVTIDTQNVKLSDANGNAATASFTPITVNVASAGTTPANSVTPTPTRTPTPTVTTPPTPSPTDGSLSIDQTSAVSPTFNENLTMSGRKAQGTTVTAQINDGTEFEVDTNTGTTTWGFTGVLGLGDNTITVRSFSGTSTQHTVSITVNRYGLGDLNASGRVDVFDLGIFSGHYGESGVQHVPGTATTLRLSDMKRDGSIDVFDLGVFAATYGLQYVYDGRVPTITSGPTPTISRSPTHTPTPTSSN